MQLMDYLLQLSQFKDKKTKIKRGMQEESGRTRRRIQICEILINIDMITQKNELLSYRSSLAFLIGFKVDFFGGGEWRQL